MSFDSEPRSSLTRRGFARSLAASAFLCGSCAALAFGATEMRRLIAYLESHRKPDGAYGWKPATRSHVTPTFGVVGSYVLLYAAVPDASAVASFVRDHYPVPERRRTERPLWRLDFEQVQTLLWLKEPIDSFRPLASTWTRPAEFTKRYELDGDPVFQHQAMAVRVRHLAGIEPSAADGAWRAYFQERRRPNGTFSLTRASDGSGGHLVNTLWGILALESLGEKAAVSSELVDWVRSCQTSSHGFTYAPDAQFGAVDDIVYTWAAVQILGRAGASPRHASACVDWIHALQTEEGGFQDRPGGFANPLATYYALDSLRLLRAAPAAPARRAPVATQHAIPDGSRVFTMQVEAPGGGSPAEAVLLAGALGIHIWSAKNSAPGWIEEAQQIARRKRVPVLFAVGNEEYGTFVKVPGLGTYSHLDDYVVPAEGNRGPQFPKKDYPYPWSEFRDMRIRQIRAAGGRMVWQFNENEELTRALLDEAVEKGTYGAICTFHFGNEDFLSSQPFLMRWYGRLPMVALQDAHGGESWWWGDFLSGFRTLFIAREPTWQGWLSALGRNHVMSVRRDRATNWKLETAGGLPNAAEFVMARKSEWTWWDAEGASRERPAAALTVLRPGMRFEAAVPEQGLAIRLRLLGNNTGQGKPQEPLADLVSLEIDGARVEPHLVSTANDRYYLHTAMKASAREAVATVRLVDSGKTVRLTTPLHRA